MISDNKSENIFLSRRNILYEKQKDAAAGTCHSSTWNVSCWLWDNKAEKTEATEQVTVTEENTTGEDAADISADDTEDIADTYDESTEFTLPVYDDFTLEQGLSEKYADMDNRSFVYNGTKLILGESTLKDLIDAGIPFDESDLNNSGNNVNVNYETERYQASINDYVTMQFKFGNFTDSEQKAEDCVLSYEIFAPLCTTAGL
mgnify:CR=1 FL=1